MIYVVVVAAAAILAAAAVWTLKQRSTPAEPVVAEPPRDAPPMTGLESALAQVKDRAGRPIGERLQAEHVDDLRVPDDTGPLLRRALDQVRPERRDASNAAHDVSSVDDEQS